MWCLSHKNYGHQFNSNGRFYFPEIFSVNRSPLLLGYQMIIFGKNFSAIGFAHSTWRCQGLSRGIQRFEKGEIFPWFEEMNILRASPVLKRLTMFFQDE
jgi:hypothetical protein